MPVNQPTVVLVGSLDTKGPEYAYVRARLQALGVRVAVVDVGILGEAFFEPDVAASDVALAAGTTLEALRSATADSSARTTALTTMARGTVDLVRGMREAGRCDGVMGMGGSGGSTVISAVLRSLPVGVPKLLVSTMAAGDVAPYVGSSDMFLLYPVTDVQGLNRVSRRVLANAARAMAGMVVFDEDGSVDEAAGAPLVAVTMMGVTTPGVQRIVAGLEASGFETIVFHANGAGGRAFEAMVAGGLVAGVVDVTTAELTAGLFGGMLQSGPDRLVTAGRLGLPQVISTGALEEINFGPLETLAARWAADGRAIVVHSPAITSVQLLPDEAHAAGRALAEKVNAARGPVCVILPLGGCTMFELPGGPWADRAVDGPLFDGIRAGLRPGIPIREVEGNLNDASFAEAAVAAFLELWAVGHPMPGSATRGPATATPPPL
jgi:uncharacterized protein (UPF0261 family)